MPESSTERMSRDIENLKADMNELRMSVAVRDEAAKNTNIRLDKIESMLSRITWLVIGGIVSGAVAFMMAGGFSGAPPI